VNDLRLSPRVPARLDASLTNGAGDALTATISNLSHGGVMVSGGPSLKQHVCDFAERDPLRDSVEVQLHCRFPDDPQPFASRCRLIYIRRQSQQAFEFGFRFVDLSRTHAGLLRRFISRSMSSVVPVATRNAGG